jgi:hypothetical protein
MRPIHHRAFDSFVLGVRPDYVIEVRRDVLGEADGPTLRHALQVPGSSLLVPSRRLARPDHELLEARYEPLRGADSEGGHLQRIGSTFGAYQGIHRASSGPPQVPQRNPEAVHLPIESAPSPVFGRLIRGAACARRALECAPDGRLGDTDLD